MNHHPCLIEIRTEELPPKALPMLLKAFQEQVSQQLTQAQFVIGKVQAYGSPRRLALWIEHVSEYQPEQLIERKGPMVSLAYDTSGQPTSALLGFIKSCQTSLEHLIEVDTAKGKALVYRSASPGQSIHTLLPTFVQKALSHLPIPKMMRWSTHTESFVRPVHSIILLYGDHIIPTTLFGIESDRLTIGHRFHAPEEMAIPHANDYVEQLKVTKVLVDIGERRSKIMHQIQKCAGEKNARAIIPDALLEEVTHLVEWPVALLCHFDERFLQVPQEALILAMQTHQKCFPLIDSDGQLLPYFVVISNIESKSPHTVIHGNERVVRARLSDAQFFYETDLKKSLEDYLPALHKVTFQAKLGSIGDKVDRLVALSRHLMQLRLPGDAEKLLQTERAALLSKSDLLSAMVNEFPELQGIMGRYYALAQGESREIADAIESHYLPKFSGDILPKNDIGQTLALADKLDTLVGIFAIGEKPTGSKDPFALRRQAIGILRIMIEHHWCYDLETLITYALSGYTKLNIVAATITADVLLFFRERIRPFYQERGITAEIVEAAMASNCGFNPVDIDQRIEAIRIFITLPQAKALAEANKRVYNLLSKNNALKGELPLHSNLLTEPAEQRLFKAIQTKIDTKTILEKAQDYIDLLCGLADLQAPIDEFFTDVMVITEDPALRTNRLSLLKMVRDLFVTVADIRLLSQ